MQKGSGRTKDNKKKHKKKPHTIKKKQKTKKKNRKKKQKTKIESKAKQNMGIHHLASCHPSCKLIAIQRYRKLEMVVFFNSDSEMEIYHIILFHEYKILPTPFWQNYYSTSSSPGLKIYRRQKILLHSISLGIGTAILINDLIL